MTTGYITPQTNLLYQIDFIASTKGKRLSVTKRHISFRFGFADVNAISNGARGMNCRGEEHEVTLTWSLTSGKRTVKFNNTEVHFSTGKREMKFDCSFPIQGNHIIKLVAHAAPAVISPTNRFRQFELFHDGLSFFDMPQIFELGGTGQDAVGNENNAYMQGTYGYPSNVPVLKNLVQNNAHQYSTSDANFVEGIPANTEQLSRHAVGTAIHPYEAAFTNEQTLTAPNSFEYGSQSFTQPPPTQPPNYAMDTSLYTSITPVNEYAPAIPPPPTYQDRTNQFMNTCEQPSFSQSIITVERESLIESEYSPLSEDQNDFAQLTPSNYNSNAPAFSFTPPRESAVSSITTPDHTENVIALQDSIVPNVDSPKYTEKLSMNSLQGELRNSPQSVRRLDELSHAMQNLVNFDDICGPSKSPTKLTMMNEEKSKRHPNTSKGLPPMAAAWNLGTQASLADIKASTTSREAPVKEVMRQTTFNQAHQYGSYYQNGGY